jgi:SAM-dependent methyltransferase
MKTLLCEKSLSILDLNPKRKYSILDFGCGSGELLGMIANLLLEGFTLVGIDEKEKTIKQAKNRYPNIDFRNEKFVDSFNFSDASFDLVISVDTLECILDRTATLTEIQRILKPDGRVLFAHWDWDTQIYNSGHKDLIRRFVSAFSDWQQDWMDDADGQMGRKLWGLFQGSGYFDGRIEPFSLIETEYKKGKYGYDRLHDIENLIEKGKIDKGDYDLILSEMENLNKRKQYFYSVTSYIYFGKKILSS